MKDMSIKSDNKSFGKHGSSDRQLVIFKIAGEEFGVDINEVKEIIRWEEVTRIPNTECYIKGVINLRGNIVVVNDLAMKLGLPSKEVDEDTRILVVEVNNNTVGMVVDSATEVLHIEGEKVQEAPDMITSGIDENYIDGVGVLDEKRLLTLLDLSKVMVSSDYEKIMDARNAAQQHFNQKKQSKNASEPSRKENGKSSKKEGKNVLKETDCDDVKNQDNPQKKK